MEGLAEDSNPKMATKAHSGILITVTGNPLRNDADVIRARRIAGILGKRWKVSMVFYEGLTPNISRLQVLLLSPRWLHDLACAILKHNIVCIYCYNDRYLGFLLSYIFKKIKIKRTCKIVFDAPAMPKQLKELGRGRLYIKLAPRLERFVVSHADLVIAQSKRDSEYFRQYNKNIQLIPNFIDGAKFRKRQDARDYIRRKYNFGPDDKIVGLIGPFDTVFNRSSIKFVADNIDRFDPKIKFLLIGICGEKESIRSDRVVYTGYVKDYVEHLSSLNAVVVPRRFATSAALNKIVESMLVGIPVFTTPAGVSDMDNVSAGKDLFIFEENKLVEKINKLIFDDELMRNVGMNGYLLAKKYYTKEEYATKLLEKVGDLIG